jgi:hypothetical protein
VKGEIMSWLENLKIGDKVIVSQHWGNDSISIVTNITKTQIIISNRKFRKNDGCQIPRDAYTNTYILEPTKERIELILRVNLIDHIRHWTNKLNPELCSSLNELKEINYKLKKLCEIKEKP